MKNKTQQNRKYYVAQRNTPLVHTLEISKKSTGYIFQCHGRRLVWRPKYGMYRQNKIEIKDILQTNVITTEQSETYFIKNYTAETNIIKVNGEEQTDCDTDDIEVTEK